jgi:hypothetical protein
MEGGLPFGPSFYDIKMNFWGFTPKAMGHESQHMCIDRFCGFIHCNVQYGMIIVAHIALKKLQFDIR